MTANDDLKPQVNLPEAWLAHIACPVCGSEDLEIKHYKSAPDQVLCNACNSSFEVSQDGLYARLVAYPPGLSEKLVNRWVSLEDLHAQGGNGLLASYATVQTPKVDVADLLSRAERLSAIGNPPYKVREALLAIPGVKEAQVEEAMLELKRMQPASRSGWFWLGVVAIAALILAILTVIVLGLDRQRPAEDASGLPAPVQQLITASGDLLKIEPVKVRYLQASGRQMSCPTQADNAAQVFGAEAAMWSSTSSGWTLISMRPQTVSVPEGMSASYPVLDDDPRMVRAKGPASLQNVIYVEIDCGG